LFVWIELPERCNTDLLYRKAVQAGILIAPGTLFSIMERYNHHLRLSAGTWNDRVEKAIAQLGRLCARLQEDQGDARRVAGASSSDAMLLTAGEELATFSARS
jgi:hypothetical protein